MSVTTSTISDSTTGVFQKYYEQSGLLKETPSKISWIGSLQACLLIGVGAFTGPLFDQGYLHTLLFCGTFALVFGMMMTSLAHEYWQALLSQGFCIGFGHGCLFIVGVGQVSLTFKRRRWMAMGLGMSGGSVGELVQGYVKGLS